MGYIDGYRNNNLEEVFHVSDSSLITLGYSTGFILLTAVLSVLFIISPPLLLSIQRLRGDMVAGGSNSLVISAACHVSNADVAEEFSELGEENQMQSSRGKFCYYFPSISPMVRLMMIDILLSRSQSFDSLRAENTTDGAREIYLPLVQRKLRWGAMLLAREISDLAAFEDGKEVSHLGFGGEEHNVTKPKEGDYYI